MNKTKFMTRIFSAINNEETEVLEQLDKDIDIAKEDGSCDTDQYVITASDDKVILHDKVNDEDTEIIEDNNGDCTFSKVDLEGNKVPDEVLPLVEEKDFSNKKEEIYQKIDRLLDNYQNYDNPRAEFDKRATQSQKDEYDRLHEELRKIREEEKKGKSYSEMSDELDSVVTCESIKFSKVKKFSLESLKSFAKGGWRDGKLYIKMGDNDVALDLKNKVAIVIDENLSCPIDPKKSFIDNLTTVEKFMKENDLKVFSLNEIGAAVIKNTDGTYEVISIEDEKDESRLDSYKKEGCKIIKRFKNTIEADKYIDKKGLKRAYSNKFSDANPTPEQEGVINFLKGFVEEHPGEAKYLVELGAKWGPDNLLEGLNHDAEGDKSYSSGDDHSVIVVMQDWESGKWKSRSYDSEEKAKSSIEQLDSKSGKGIGAYLVLDEYKNNASKIVKDLNANTPFAKSQLQKWTKKFSNKFSKFSPAVAKMFSDDNNEVKRNLRSAVKAAIGSLGLQVPHAKFEDGHATITMKIHHDKVDEVKKAISGLRSDIEVTCKCSDPSKTDLTWYDLIFTQK